jgi:serine/threonine protein kinase HipA of HipAB toxin-antitoxin module
VNNNDDHAHNQGLLQRQNARRLSPAHDFVPEPVARIEDAISR